MSTVTANRAIGVVADGGGIFKESGTVVLVLSAVGRNLPDNCRPLGSVPGCS